MKRRIQIIVFIIALVLIAGFLFCPGEKAKTQKNTFRFVPDVPYVQGGDENPHQRLDLYLPDEKKTPFPVVVLIHGGSWQAGDRKDVGPAGAYLAQRGYGAVSVGYRLYPEAKFPAMAEDAAAALAWVAKSIRSYGGDPQRIALLGYSAGGHLASLIATNPKYLQAHGLSPSLINRVMGLSGVYRIFPGVYDDIFSTDKAALADASPIEHVSKDTPPFLILYAQDDLPTLDKQAAQMTKRLSEYGVPVRMRMIENRDHLSIMLKMGKSDDKAILEVQEFLADL